MFTFKLIVCCRNMDESKQACISVTVLVYFSKLSKQTVKDANVVMLSTNDLSG